MLVCNALQPVRACDGGRASERAAIWRGYEAIGAASRGRGCAHLDGGVARGHERAALRDCVPLAPLNVLEQIWAVLLEVGVGKLPSIWIDFLEPLQPQEGVALAQMPRGGCVASPLMRACCAVCSGRHRARRVGLAGSGAACTDAPRPEHIARKLQDHVAPQPGGSYEMTQNTLPLQHAFSPAAQAPCATVLRRERSWLAAPLYDTAPCSGIHHFWGTAGLERGTHIGVELPHEGGEVVVLEVFRQQHLGKLWWVPDNETAAVVDEFRRELERGAAMGLQGCQPQQKDRRCTQWPLWHARTPLRTRRAHLSPDADQATMSSVADSETRSNLHECAPFHVTVTPDEARRARTHRRLGRARFEQEGRNRHGRSACGSVVHQKRCAESAASSLRALATLHGPRAARSRRTARRRAEKQVPALPGVSAT